MAQTVSQPTVYANGLNMPVQRLKVAILSLDVPCSGPVTHSGEILTTGQSHQNEYSTFTVVHTLFSFYLCH